MREIIPNADDVSRLIFEPSMRVDQQIHWPAVFMFKTEDGSCESVVWRKYAPDQAAVHDLGCAKQTADRAAGKTKCTYVGSMTASVGIIRAIKNKNGAGFTIIHEPTEGIHHAHINLVNHTSKLDRSELKFLLQKVFAALVSHQCG